MENKCKFRPSPEYRLWKYFTFIQIYLIKTVKNDLDY